MASQQSASGFEVDAAGAPGPRAAVWFALSGFAIAQPLFDVLGRHAEFFVVRGSGAGAIVAFAVALVTVPPLCVIFVMWAVRLVLPKVAPEIGRVAIAVFVGVTALPPLLRAAALSDSVALGVAAAAGCAGAYAYGRFPPFRTLLRVLSVAPVLFAAHFLLATDARSLVFAQESEIAPAAVTHRDVPIVLVVFDELPLTSLLDENGEIDRIRYPAFAEIAGQSTWFRGVSAVSARTNLAMPAILTGRQPALTRRLPIRADYPENLFSLLEDVYELNVVETDTDLNASRAAEIDRRGGMILDVSLIYLHLLLPEPVRARLPSLADAWGDFLRGAEAGPAENFEQQATTQSTPVRGDRVIPQFFAFPRFIESITPLSAGGKPPLYFLHLTLPHSPWLLLEDGRRYLPKNRYGFADGRWPDEPWWSTDAYRRHLLQLAYTDQLLGILLARLKSSGVFDPGVVVVTADHGASFWPGGPFREPLQVKHAEDLLHVPLFVKRPHQTMGDVDDRFGESVDILPTLADVAGVALPWPIDGCSLLRSECAARSTRHLVVERLYRALSDARYPPDILERDDTLRRKISLFGSGDRSVYAVADGEGLLGRSVDEIPVAMADGGSVDLDPAVRKLLDHAPPGFVPARIVGRLELRSLLATTPEIAIAIRGRIATIVPAPFDGTDGRRIAAMLPPDAIPGSLADLALYRVDRNAEPLGLIPLAIR